MLSRALDWHPEAMSVPREAAYIHKSFVGNQAEAPNWEWKELAGGNDRRIAALRAASEARADADFVGYYDSLDPQNFQKAFRRVQTAGGSYFDALASAMIAGSPRVAARYGGKAVRLVVKLPFFAEAVFKQIAWPGDRLIHIRRDPVARYLSAKKRSTKRFGVKGVMDFTTFQALIPAASHALAKAAGKDVMFVEYEALREGKETLAEIARFLGLEWSDTLLKQTRHGFERMLPSSYGFINSGSHEDDALRISAAASLANDAERSYVALLDSIAHAGGGDFESLRVLAAEPFIEDAADSSAQRIEFLERHLKPMLDEGIGTSLAVMLRDRSLGVL